MTHKFISYCNNSKALRIFFQRDLSVPYLRPQRRTDYTVHWQPLSGTPPRTPWVPPPGWPDSPPLESHPATDDITIHTSSVTSQHRGSLLMKVQLYLYWPLIFENYLYLFHSSYKSTLFPPNTTDPPKSRRLNSFF